MYIVRKKCKSNTSIMVKIKFIIIIDLLGAVPGEVEKSQDWITSVLPVIIKPAIPI
jgi:hypothetical protein